MDFGLDRWNPYELTRPDGWEAAVDAGGREADWMRRCGAFDAYHVDCVEDMVLASLEWEWVAYGRLGGDVRVELRVYLLGQEEGRFDLKLTGTERAALDADMRAWLRDDGVLDTDGNVVGGDWL